MLNVPEIVFNKMCNRVEELGEFASPYALIVKSDALEHITQNFQECSRDLPHGLERGCEHSEHLVLSDDRLAHILAALRYVGQEPY